ncbi:MAG: hypothetical protein ACLSH3_07910 [Alistipes finegoldii]
MLKIRFSYGANGNNAISRYMSLDRLYSTNGVKYIWGDGGSASNSAYLPSDGIGNPDLRWETPIRPTSVSTSSSSTDVWAVR